MALRQQCADAGDIPDEWHSTQINLLELVTQQWPDLADLWVTEFLFADQGERVLNGSNQNKKGNRFWLDEVQLVTSDRDAGPPPVPVDGFPDRPFVSVVFPDRLFHHSFEAGPMPWSDWLQGAVDFAPFGATGSKCARVFAFEPDPYLATMIWKGWIDVQRYPILSFDYRFPPEAALGLLVNLGESYSVLPLTRKVTPENSRRERRDTYVAPLVPGCIADNTWRTLRIDLFDLLRQRYPRRKSFRVRTLQTQRVAGRNPLGTSCYFDNFSAHSRRAGRVRFVWHLPAGTTAISYALDSRPDTVPPPVPAPGTAGSAEYDLAPGYHYFHIRTRKKGKWSDPVHVPVHLK